MITKPFVKALLWALSLMIGTTLITPCLMEFMVMDPPPGTYLLWLNIVLLWWTIMFLPTVRIYYTIEKREAEEKENNAQHN